MVFLCFSKLLFFSGRSPAVVVSKKPRAEEEEEKPDHTKDMEDPVSEPVITEVNYFVNF